MAALLFGIALIVQGPWLFGLVWEAIGTITTERGLDPSEFAPASQMPFDPATCQFLDNRAGCLQPPSFGPLYAPEPSPSATPRDSLQITIPIAPIAP